MTARFNWIGGRCASMRRWWSGTTGVRTIERQEKQVVIGATSPTGMNYVCEARQQLLGANSRS